MIERPDTKIRYHYEAAGRLASIYVERAARQILNDNPKAHEFVMGMGCYFFWTRGKNSNQIETKDLVGGPEFADFISEWDDCFKITGEPMRFTKTGKKITDW